MPVLVSEMVENNRPGSVSVLEDHSTDKMPKLAPSMRKLGHDPAEDATDAPTLCSERIIPVDPAKRLKLYTRPIM